MKPTRWATKALLTAARAPRLATQASRRPAPLGPLAAQLETNGFVALGQRFTAPDCDLGLVAGQAKGKAFIDVRPRFRAETDAAAVHILAQPDIGAMITDYFGGNPWLWNIALNYSEPSDQLLDSQLWHFDYGDVKQLHLMAYFSDVSEDSGPFTFLPRDVSSTVPRHPLLIERMTDATLAARHNIDVAAARTRLVGRRGEVFANDPGVLMHQGARCSTTRLVLFISFTSAAPMSLGGRATIGTADRQALGAQYRLASPDGPIPPSAFA